MNDKQQLMALGDEMARRNTTTSLGGGFELDRYDAGALNDFGGGYIDWWWDYLRAELDSAFNFYQDQIERAQLDSGRPEAEHSATQRQRDELLAALEALVTIVADTRHPDPDDVYAVIAEARDTISQVRNEI